MSDQPIAEAAT